MINVGEDVEKLESLCTAGWNVKWYQYYGTVQQFLKNLKTKLPHDPVVPLLLINQKN